MKRFVRYVLLMTIIVVILPLIIVRGCSTVIEDIVPEEKEDMKLKVYIKGQDEVEEMSLEEYLMGVVAAEMPADFELEALKAQAIAARTYVYGRMKKIYSPKDDTHKGADICTDSAHCQAWIKKDDAMAKWGTLKAFDNWGKIERAVRETEGIIILYDKKVVNPVFHANSGGMTENAEDVWEGTKVPYLKSVKSEGEDKSSGYKVETVFKEEEITKKLKEEYPDIEIEAEDLLEEIEILERTRAGRVKEIRIEDVVIKGTQLRSLLGLRSTNFNIEKGDNNEVIITTIGYGHGVGMSQWGANSLAKNGGTYEEILKHYYTGISLDTIENIELDSK
ncbi:stage II sporulation protein D [Acetivibrio mesophilus]|uniref:Stage II sporulation protein D n=1 Tax=Acetivibrio mesophilus TaxID=2487273 RepID=A0A4Q0I4Y4_9FIRM|nr:stage II sporulation protein D [Acetivibrio mesophilus]ODM27420.1 stage II sporulation protein D [Clostridium sp. Bc-iso-3]RXE59380.1 stage II sporulation protein D [Acetivibrio mesophilus]HHV30161.1 stage II sporulation protein D [Clostridium sp.]